MVDSIDQSFTNTEELQDVDFWNQLNQNSKIATASSYRKTHNEFPNNYSYSLSNWSRCKLNEQMDFIHRAQIEELSSQRIQVRNKTRRDFKSHIDQLKEKFSGDASHLMKDYDDLKAILTKRDKEIQQLNKYIGEQNCVVNQYRIKRRKAHLKSRVFHDFGVAECIEELDKSEELKHKVELMEDIVTLYREDVDEINDKLNIITEQSIQQTNEYEIQRDDIIKEDLRNKEIHDSRILHLRNEFEEYKKSAEQEIELRLVIESRQLSMINTLKQELKSAKSVIQIPRLRSKVQSKLKVKNSMKERKRSSPLPNYRKVNSKHETTRRFSSHRLMSAPDYRDIKNSNADSSSVVGVPTTWKFKEISLGRSC